LSHIDPGTEEESEEFVRRIYEQRHIDLSSDSPAVNATSRLANPESPDNRVPDRGWQFDGTLDTWRKRDGRDRAKVVYQVLLALWKDADPDLPIVRQANADYARLR
jgi:hypothetical protein